MENFETDVVIIGAGPVGLFAVFQCGMMGLNVHVIDALDRVGGQCAALYPEKPIYDIPAHPMVSGHDLIKNLKAQAAPFDPTYHLDQRVESISESGNGTWMVTTSTGTLIQTKIIMIAAGVGAFGPNRPPLDHIERYEESSIVYYVKKRDVFKDKKIVIAGGGDSAVDWALSLSDIAEKVYLVHRRPKFRAAPESISQLHRKVQEGRLELVVPYQLSGLEGDGAMLQAVLVSTLEGDQRRLEADYLLPFFGLSTNLGPISTWGLNLDKNHITVDRHTSQTNIKGIFAIGDIATYPHKLKLILTGFAEAAQASHEARALIHPHDVWHFEYSTTQGVPGK